MVMRWLARTHRPGLVWYKPAEIGAQIKRSESAVRKRSARLKIVVAKQRAKGKY
jgi:hypothetical protein